MKRTIRKMWHKMGVKGRFAAGIVMIIAGSVLASVVTDAMLRTNNFMFNPKYKENLFRSIFLIPLIVYGIFYIGCYGWCARRNTGDAGIYRGLPLLFFAAVIIQTGGLAAYMMLQGFWLDASVFAYAGSACAAVMFGIALFGAKPF